MRPITTGCAAMLAALSLLAATPASAAHNSQLYQAANQYRAAVRVFERAVLRAPCFDRQDERIVDRLEDATSRLRSAARHPDDLYQLQVTWNEIQLLQQLVARTIIGHPVCPLGRELVFGWDRVTHAGADFAAQLALVQCDVPGYGVPRRPIYAVPIHHHHHHVHEEPVIPSRPLPYWHPSRTPYGQGMTGIDALKQDRVITAPNLEPRDSSDIRKVTPSPRVPQGAQLQRTFGSPAPMQGGISGAPTQRTIGAAKTGDKLMRR